MAANDSEFPRFFKVALKKTCMTGELNLPDKFSKYAVRIEEKILIILRNGYQWEVKFCKKRNSIRGLKPILDSLKCTAGAFLFMKYNGKGIFLCDIFPLTEESAEEPTDWTVKCDFLGRNILKIIFSEDGSFNEMVLPPRVLGKLKNQIEDNLLLKMKNGKEYIANYKKSTNQLSGFKQLKDSIEIQFGNVVVLSPQNDGTYILSVFGTDGMEKNPRGSNTEEAQDSVYKFEILIKPSHLQKYSQGVFVPSNYKKITEGWEPFQIIEVTNGIKRWNIEIKKRDGRTELHRGWEFMWKELNLKPGDTCIFESLGSKTKFHVRVIYQLR